MRITHQLKVVVIVYIFKDFYNNKVKLSFESEPFSKTPKHVWVIARYKGQWLLTHHRSRGLEFPGGKVEKGETAEEAAHREIMEETGATAEKLHYVAQYFVSGKGGTIIKNVYFAEIATLVKQPTYYETHGPVLVEQLPDNIRKNKSYSFMMKDDVLLRCLAYIENNLLKK